MFKPHEELTTNDCICKIPNPYTNCLQSELLRDPECPYHNYTQPETKYEKHPFGKTGVREIKK